jgi:hypothetical protein
MTEKVCQKFNFPAAKLGTVNGTLCFLFLFLSIPIPMNGIVKQFLNELVRRPPPPYFFNFPQLFP